MGTTKHTRKTGATTVKKDGKIVGNIGKGKTKTPITLHPTKMEDVGTKNKKVVSSNTIESAHKLFATEYGSMQMMQDFVDDTVMADIPRKYYKPDNAGFVPEVTVYTLPSTDEIKVTTDDNTLVVTLRTHNGAVLASSRQKFGKLSVLG